MKTSWSRGEIIAFFSAVVAVITAAAAWIVVPEVRRWTGLEISRADVKTNPPETVHPNSEPVQSIQPNVEAAQIQIDAKAKYSYIVLPNLCQSRSNIGKELFEDDGVRISYFVFSIANNGGREAKELKLEIPLTGQYVIRRNNATSPIAEIKNNEIDIGALRPSTNVEIIVWDTSASLKVYGFQRKGYQITRPDGPAIPIAFSDGGL